jgi:hypothetical protein
MLKTRVIRVVNADTTTGANTGKSIYVGNASRIGVLLRVSGHSSGNTAFSFKAGMEQGMGEDTTTPTMTTFNMMIDNVTNTNAQNPTRVASKTLSANGDALLWVDPACLISWLEVDYNTTTDGAASVFIILQEDASA